ncbi:MAG: hypothetical protein PHE79_04910 [Eubacteriales bacterium]|nr:hypothetical protein [Eubacteriales bacterium]
MKKAPVAANEQGARENTQLNVTSAEGNCQEPLILLVEKEGRSDGD